MVMIQVSFKELIGKFTNNSHLINERWIEIERNYTSKKRHYHTLNHLENLLDLLVNVKNEIKNWDTILFSLYYHDIIYNSLKSDNEEKSAILAGKRMQELSVPQEQIELCKSQILATKAHTKAIDSDTNYFTDADLSILGQSWEMYSLYYKNVRREYSIYPDFLYNPGRKKVLNHFLSMDRIFKTDYFHQQFEVTARKNLTKELEGLTL
jgi:predicted metal-dependent HD superfamily phosphohydrolase